LGKPFVSVLIDTYNHERFIEKAIVSVLEQDFPASDREILVVDDGSTDRTPEIARKFEPHVRLLRKENGGQASAFNTGIPECRGEIIAFLDGDDWWENKKLSVVVAAFASHPQIGTVGHGFTESDEDGMPLAVVASKIECESRLRDLKEGSDFLTLRSFLGTSRLAIRRDILRQVGPLPCGLRIEADEFLATVRTALGGVLILREPLTNYRYHSANLSQFEEWKVAKVKRKHDSLPALSPDRGRGHISAGASGEGAIRVEAVSLDDYCSRNAPPQFIKCDVEGGVGEVFRGARRLLKEHRPGILCELHGGELRSTLLQEFVSQGYRCHDCDATHILALPR